MGESIDWAQYVSYSEESPTKLVWSAQTKNRKFNKGDIAGSWNNVKKYYYVKIDNSNYSVHRIVYELMVGKIPDGFVIDHKDRDTANNSYTNLVAVTHRHNMQNMKKNKNNKSGVVGVSLVPFGEYQYWKAAWQDMDGKQCHKTFSVLKHGYDEAFRLAVEAREQALTEMNQQGARYTEGHGK